MLLKSILAGYLKTITAVRENITEQSQRNCHVTDKNVTCPPACRVGSRVNNVSGAYLFSENARAEMTTQMSIPTTVISQGLAGSRGKFSEKSTAGANTAR